MRVVRAAVAGLVCFAFAMPAMAQRDNMRCYAMKAVKDLPRFGKTDATKKFFGVFNDVLDVANPQGLDPAAVPGEQGTYQISKVRDVCIVADVDEGGTNDPRALIAYQTKRQKGLCVGDPAVPCKKDAECDALGLGACLAIPKWDKKDPRNTSVRVYDGLVDLRVDFGKEVGVLLPASVELASNGNWGGVPTGEESFKCYQIKPTKNSCVGGSNDGGACKKAGDNIDCPGGGACVANAKFPKETHPAGLVVSVADDVSGLFDPTDPEKPLALSKVRTFCQASDSKFATEAYLDRNEPQAGLLCYQGKTPKAACDGGDNNNLPCKGDADCPDGTCRVEPKFSNKNPLVQNLYVEDAIFQHRLNIGKEGTLCTPACRGYEDFAFKPGLLAHISHLALGPLGAAPELAGLPRGVDVDFDPTSHAPNTEPADGIDNQLQGLGPILNATLQEGLDDGGFTLLFQASALANGSINISGFSGNLDATPGCSVGTGDPGDPIDPADPSDPCNYRASASNFVPDLTGSCRDEAIISLDVDVAGLPGTATASGGGPGNNFTLDIPFGGADFAITAQNVRVEAEITHDGSGILEIKGVLGGGVNHADLVASVEALPDSCNGGANDGNTCTGGGDCPGGTCELIGGFDAANLAFFIGFAFPPDLDLDGDTVNESVSLGLLFRATRAVGVGVD